MSKVQLESYIVQKPEIRFGWGFNLFSGEIRYGWGLIFLKMLR